MTDEEQPWHAGKAPEPLGVGIVVPVHQSYVPPPGVEWMFRDERAGTNWMGVAEDRSSVRITRPA